MLRILRRGWDAAGRPQNATRAWRDQRGRQHPPGVRSV